MNEYGTMEYQADGLAPEADDDGDSLTNQQESRAGTDPLGALGTLVARIEAEVGFGVLIKWDAGLGNTCAIETSTGFDHLASRSRSLHASWRDPMKA